MNPISGPCSIPVSALRSGINRPRPLRPVASFTAPVHSFHVVSVNGASGKQGQCLRDKFLVLIVDQRLGTLRTQGPPFCQIMARGDVVAGHGPESVLAELRERQVHRDRIWRCPRARIANNVRSAGTGRFRQTWSRADPKWLRSKPSTNSSMLARNSIGCEEPSRAMCDNRAKGSTPRSRRSRRARVPRRLDSASP